MIRREFITLIGGSVAWPLAAWAQRLEMPVIGLLQSGGPSSWDFTGFRQGLKDTGYVEGPNLAIEVRWADDDPDRLRELAADLVRRQVAVIVASGGAAAALAAKAATDTIPIVFGAGTDPVQQGLVASLNRPGGNVTGMTSLIAELVGKQLGMLHELLPQASHFGFLSYPKAPGYELLVKDAQAAASAIGGTIDILTASTSGEIDAVFVRIANEKRVQGLLVAPDAFFMGARVQLVILAARSIAAADEGRSLPVRARSASAPITDSADMPRPHLRHWCSLKRRDPPGRKQYHHAAKAISTSPPRAAVAASSPAS